MSPDIIKDLHTFITLPASEAQEKFQSLDESFQQVLDDETQPDVTEWALSTVRVLLRNVLTQKETGGETFLAEKLSSLLYKGTLAFAQRESKLRQAEQKRCFQDHRPLCKLLEDMTMLPAEQKRDFSYILSVNPYSSQEELEQGLMVLAEAGLIEEGLMQHDVVLSNEGYFLLNASR